LHIGSKNTIIPFTDIKTLKNYFAFGDTEETRTQHAFAIHKTIVEHILHRYRSRELLKKSSVKLEIEQEVGRCCECIFIVHPFFVKI
jgi:hypothetical protein